MKNFVYSGRSLTFTASEPLISGQPYILGNAFGVVSNSLKVGESGELFVEGAFRLKKDPARDLKTGQKLFWDSGKKLLTDLEQIQNEKLKQVGLAAEDAPIQQEEVICRLNGVAL